MTKGKVIVAGGTGLIGKILVKRLLESGYEVVLLSRQSSTEFRHPSMRAVRWDGKTLGAWAGETESARAIINLCGSGIADKGWTEERKRLILNSRIHPLQALVQAAVRSAAPPKTIISASAVGIYGDVPPDQTVLENHSRGRGYLSDVCVQWEKAALTAEQFGIRTVLARFGMVLSADGGALPRLLPLFRMYLGGPVGSGRQILPWIHAEDAVAALLFALETHELSGPVNVTSPHPVSMKDFCSELGRAAGRPSWLPVPGFVVRALMGDAAEVVLAGQRALPRKLMDKGFRFKYAELDKALKNIIGGSI